MKKNLKNLGLFCLAFLMAIAFYPSNVKAEGTIYKNSKYDDSFHSDVRYTKEKSSYEYSHIVLVDDIPSIGEEVEFDRDNFPRGYQSNRNATLDCYSGYYVSESGKNATFLSSKDSTDPEITYKITDETKYILRFVDDDNRYEQVSAQEIDADKLNYIIRYKCDYGTWSYYDGKHMSPRIVMYYKESKFSGLRELACVFITYHVQETMDGFKRIDDVVYFDKENEAEKKDNTKNVDKEKEEKTKKKEQDDIDKELLVMLLDAKEVDSLESLPYRDFASVENHTKTEAYNMEETGTDFFIDYEDGDTFSIESDRVDSFDLYIAVKNTEGKYSYYSLGNDIYEFNTFYCYLTEKESSLYKPIVIMVEGKDKDSIEKITLYVKEIF